MLLENLGIDRAIRFGKIEDWKAAIEEIENRRFREPALIPKSPAWADLSRSQITSSRPHGGLRGQRVLR